MKVKESLEERRSRIATTLCVGISLFFLGSFAFVEESEAKPKSKGSLTVACGPIMYNVDLDGCNDDEKEEAYEECVKHKCGNCGAIWDGDGASDNDGGDDDEPDTTD